MTLILPIFGCETAVVNVDIPAIDQKIVVYGSANNRHDFSLISVTKSEPLLNNNQVNDFDIVQDASVLLTGPSSAFPFTYYNTVDRYYNDLPLELVPGETYELTVNVPGFDEVKAKATMPLPLSNVSSSLDSVGSDFDKQYIFEFNLDENPAVPEYYRVEAVYASGVDSIPLYNFPQVFSDVTASNGRVGFRSTVFETELPLEKVFVLLSAISEEEYRYEKALEKYDPGNPFAEPTPLPSNMENGLGIFTLKNSIRIFYR